MVGVALGWIEQVGHWRGANADAVAIDAPRPEGARRRQVETRNARADHCVFRVRGKRFQRAEWILQVVEDAEEEREAVAPTGQFELPIEIGFEDLDRRAERSLERTHALATVVVGRRIVDHVHRNPEALHEERRVAIGGSDIHCGTSAEKIQQVAIVPREQRIKQREVVEGPIRIPGTPVECRAALRRLQAIAKNHGCRANRPDVHSNCFPMPVARKYANIAAASVRGQAGCR